MNKLELLSAMTNMGKFVEPRTPDNDVSRFLSEAFDNVFGTPKNEVKMIKNIIIMSANSEPEKAKEMLEKFSGAYMLWKEAQDVKDSS